MKHSPDVFVLFGAILLPVAAYAYPLNDSGQQACFDVDGKQVDCALLADDGRYGRDIAFAGKHLHKSGSGKSGFDFTKIANDGSELPADAVLGSQPREWACTRDNVTGLLWEMKTAAKTDLRYGEHGYSWLATNFAGNPALEAATAELAKTPSDACSSKLTGGVCNTVAYAKAVNDLRLCGYSDWSLPNVSELLSIVDYGATNAPLIDIEFFPNTASRWYWVQSGYALDPGNAVWDIHFGKGFVGVGNNTSSAAVRLVHRPKRAE